MNRVLKGLLAGAAILCCATASQAETLRLLTWGGYAPDAVVALFKKKYPDIDVQVTLSNNEEMVAKLRATGGAGFDLAQPSVSRIVAAQTEYGIYKPLDLSRIDTTVFRPEMMKAMEDNAKIDGKIYSVPHVWGTQGLIVDRSKAPDAKSWSDLCDPRYKGRVSMRLKRAILLGMAFDMGKDPFKAYRDPAEYQKILDALTEKLIACKANVKTYWTGGDDLTRLMLSGEVVLSDAWDSTAFKLYGQNHNIVFVPPRTGALAWIDTFSIPAKGEADDAAYKWINFVMQPEIVTLISGSSGAIGAVKGAIELMPAESRAAVEAAFDEKALANLKFMPSVPAGIEDMEGKVLERVKAASN
ncbi:spermidine/putrescine transport system substrate-binding protein [Tistlia consotensis]|uniref:Spermidine/putrescine transport system substrate-binding protein n=1 Tax=Tistlia consotensis USBA 355 TaxID=560819 RepID=A0A1Y6CCG3_9PROT|nr:extracellular solute-binding protein [Tistlia consotensis]SMF54474.1 spermidine/putrescine transport system substrate-binding protein [Tistlia consotensis USBA 355]SNR86994.1 spermidine/putrescine transport system substrate-binding protein [Tistlia consotensis]